MNKRKNPIDQSNGRMGRTEMTERLSPWVLTESRK
jgi:hypothetical protein